MSFSGKHRKRTVVAWLILQGVVPGLQQRKQICMTIFYRDPPHGLQADWRQSRPGHVRVYSERHLVHSRNRRHLSDRL
ncbi:hypothetical protein B0H15DRAFT_834402 [Mycena belliarum]|uniref:Uncharacterized protein n=1 Tax=Mycena belliarum TaxID=1033014 RepID=A0AAD6XTG9_9AGAR|nr:hypothetical protein B0H15DRAFT_834402 [Mycena belliae]